MTVDGVGVCIVGIDIGIDIGILFLKKVNSNFLNLYHLS